MSVKETIAAAADEVFGEVGFDAASTRVIAERSGVNKALIHYHFGSKAKLLGVVLDSYYSRLGRVVAQSLDGEASLRQRVERLVDAYSDFLASNQRFSRIVQRESSGKNAHLIRERMVPLFELGKRLVVDSFPATAGGELAAEHLLVTVYGLVVTYFSYSDVLEPLVGADPTSAESLAARKRHVQRVVGLLLDALEGGQ